MNLRKQLPMCLIVLIGLKCVIMDRIVHLSDDWSNCVAIVLYSNVVNAPPAAPMALKYYRMVGMHELNPELNKG